VPERLSAKKMMDQRLEYLHINPIKAGIMARPEYWRYSSAGLYAGIDQRFQIELMEQIRRIRWRRKSEDLRQ